MSLKTKLRSFFASLLVVSISVVASAQQLQPFGPVEYTHDLQPFKMFELRNFESGPDLNEGYFFSYDKVSWAFSGERNTVGNMNATARSLDLFRGSPNPPNLISNGLTSTHPRSSSAAGDRYEFGYMIGQHGWLASVLDGPKTSDDTTFGLGANNPNGSVAILFTFPVGLLDGFTGLDLDGDGVIVGDFDDAVTFLTTFQTVRVRNFSETHGIELMKAYRFKPGKHGNVLEFYYGARYLRFDDNFRVDTTGGTLGASFWDTKVVNNMIGPQIGFKYRKDNGRWSINSQGRFMFGYNIQNSTQTGSIGQNLNPGAFGVPFFFNPTVFSQGKINQDFSPVAEMRIEAAYHLTEGIAFKLGWTGTYIDNIRRASTSVNYNLPNMGFVNNGTQSIFVNGVNVGFEINR